MTPLFANVVLDTFIKGGPIMWPILGCLLAALVVVVERSLWWWSLTRRQGGGTLNEVLDAIAQGRFEQAARATQQSNNPFLATIHDGLAG
jgi:biopolymer transport protein ExbB